MKITIHLPPDLLQSVDLRARELGINRNRYIIKALERALKQETHWSAALIEHLTAAQSDEECQQTLEEIRQTISTYRTRRKPPVV